MSGGYPFIEKHEIMNIAITGHTSGLGKALFDHFSKHHNVVGFSRSNGYHIIENQDCLISRLAEFDLFFNNAHSETTQSTLLLKLYDKLPIVTSGSMGADYSFIDNQYYKDKKTIERIHKQVCKKRSHPLLLLKMGYLENYKDKITISYNDIIESIEFWLENPRITLIEFDNII